MWVAKVSAVRSPSPLIVLASKGRCKRWLCPFVLRGCGFQAVTNLFTLPVRLYVLAKFLCTCVDNKEYNIQCFVFIPFQSCCSSNCFVC